MKLRILLPILALICIVLPTAVMGSDALGVATSYDTEGISQPQAPVELLDMRSRASKTTWLGSNKYSLDVSIGSIHYKDNPDDPNEQWKEIDTAIVESPKANWDWEVVKGNWHLLIKNDTSVALGKDGNWLGFRYEGFAYYDSFTGDYQILQSKNDVSPTIDGNKIRWEGLFYGVNLEYLYGADGFKENLEVTQTARDWLVDHPPENYGLNNGTTYLVGYLECDWQGAYPAEDEQGGLVSFDDLEFEGKRIFWRHPIKDKIVTALPVGYAIHEALEPEEWVKIRHRFYLHDNGKHYLLFGAKVTKLNQYPSGTIIIDPSIDEQVGASSDDCYTYDHPDHALQFSLTESQFAFGYNICSGARFQTVNVPQSSTINTAYLTVRAERDLSGSIDSVQIYGNDVDDAATFSNASDFNNRVLTSAKVNWAPGSWTVDSNYNSPEIKTIIQEIVNRAGWAANQDMAIIVHHEGSSSNYRYAYSYNGNPADAPKLHIEYTAGGVVAPTVVTNAATSVEETTATLSGNITATGGENCTHRGFQWDTDSGVPYSSNWTESGDYGVSQFTHGITGLTKGELYYYRAGANNSAGWGWGSEVTFLTKPDAPNSLADQSRGSTWIYITWIKGTGANHTQVRYDTTGYPADNTSGTQAYYGTGTSVNITGLSPSQMPYIRAWSIAEEGGLLQYSDASDDDTAWTRPGDPSNLATSNATCSTVDLVWAKGASSNKTHIRWKVGSYPTDVTDGTQAYFGTDNSTTATSLTHNSTIYFAGWAYSDNSTYYSSNSTQDTGTTLLTSAPTVTTANATSVTHNSAQLNGSITDVSCQNADTRLFEWGLSSGNYTDNWTAGGSFGTGAFNHTVTSLSANTTYYYRAGAKNDAGWAYGGEISFTTSAAPSGLSAPTGFTVIDLGGIGVGATWTIGTGSTFTMIRMSRDDYPAGVTDGELIYYGAENTANSTGYAIPAFSYYFRAWGFESDNITYSSDYADASIGGEDMETIGEQLTLFNTFLSGTTGLILAIGVTALAFWQKDMILFIVSGIVMILVGGQWIDDYAGVTIVLWGLGVYQLLKALILALEIGGPAKGWSQFKGFYQKIRGT